MMDKLTYLETIAAEEKEAKKAAREKRKQQRQYYKRLFYIPLVLKYLSLFLIMFFYSYILVKYGFILGISQKEKVEMICEKIPTNPIKRTIFSCTLPKTGASLDSK